MGEPEKPIDAAREEIKRSLHLIATHPEDLMEDEQEKILAMFDELRKRAERYVACVWCGKLVMELEEYPKDPEDFKKIVKMCQDHDTQCPDNPLAKRIRELEKKCRPYTTPHLGSRDTRPPNGGWAPGSYMCKCFNCNEQFIGDKRAVRCAPCAYKEQPTRKCGYNIQGYCKFHLGNQTTPTSKIAKIGCHRGFCPWEARNKDDGWWTYGDEAEISWEESHKQDLKH